LFHALVSNRHQSVIAATPSGSDARIDTVTGENGKGTAGSWAKSAKVGPMLVVNVELRVPGVP